MEGYGDPGSHPASRLQTGSDESEDDYPKLLKIVYDCETNRFARRLRNFSSFMKAFDAGWKRICEVTEGGKLKVSYKSPEGKIFNKANYGKFLNYLRHQQHNGQALSRDNFSFGETFLGFKEVT